MGTVASACTRNIFEHARNAFQHSTKVKVRICCRTLPDAWQTCAASGSAPVHPCLRAREKNQDTRAGSTLDEEEPVGSPQGGRHAPLLHHRCEEFHLQPAAVAPSNHSDLFPNLFPPSRAESCKALTFSAVAPMSSLWYRSSLLRTPASPFIYPDTQCTACE